LNALSEGTGGRKEKHVITILQKAYALLMTAKDSKVKSREKKRCFFAASPRNRMRGGPSSGAGVCRLTNWNCIYVTKEKPGKLKKPNHLDVQMEDDAVAEKRIGKGRDQEGRN